MGFGYAGATLGLASTPLGTLTIEEAAAAIVVGAALINSLKLNRVRLIG